MMNEHSDKRADDDARFNLAKRAVFLSLADIAAQKVVNVCYKSFKKDLRQLVSFERRMQHQTQKIRILFMMIKRVQSHTVKYAEIVFLFDLIGNFRKRIVKAVVARLVVQNRSVKLVLVRKMLKNNRFLNACGVRDLFRRRPAKTALREKAHRYFAELLAPLVAGHPAIRSSKKFIQFSILPTI